jgi:5-hydroxyisourate hydrolase
VTRAQISYGNSNVVATDTMKNVILRRALELDGPTLEGFLDELGHGFLGTYPEMEGLRLAARELPFAPGACSSASACWRRSRSGARTTRTTRCPGATPIARPTRPRSRPGADHAGALAVSLTTHVLDVSRGRPAAGVEITLVRGDEVLANAVTNADGRTDAPLLERLETGIYELRFAVGGYFAQDAEPPFLDVVPVRFGVSEPGAHHHVPLLVAPGGYSTYRGS